MVIVSFQSCRLCLCAHFVSKKKMQITNGRCCGISTKRIKHSVQAIASSVVQDDTPIPTLTSTRTQKISMTRHASSTHTTGSIMFDALLRSLVGANCFQPGLCYGGSNNICRSHPKKAQPGSPRCRSTVACFVCCLYRR